MEGIRSSASNPCPVCSRKHGDLVGRKFQRLAIVRCSGRQRKRNTIWTCRCDCGFLLDVEQSQLTTLNTGSCGCLAKECWQRNKCAIKHGKHGTKVYRAWRSMKDRCLNSRSQVFKDYGGRGIQVCDRWLEFENFLEDMGEPTNPNSTIERLDNNRGYEPGNCAWVSQKTQNRNRRNTIRVTFDGQEKPLSEWAEIFDVPPGLLRDRVIKLGWDMGRALTTPKKGGEI